MKKKYILTAFAVMLALSSCQKKEENATHSGGNAILYAVMEDCSNPTKTSISPKEDGGYIVSWNQGDVISVNGVNYIAQKSGQSGIQFNKDDPQAAEPQGNFYACYPTELGLTSEESTGTLPQTQTYGGKDDEGKVIISNVPAYAYCADDGSKEPRTLAFHNLCGVLGVKVTSEDITQVQSLRVSSNKSLCGEFFLSEDDIPCAALMDTLASDKFWVKLTIDGAPVEPTADGNMFYITLPVGGYDYLKIELSSDGENYTQTMQTKAGKRITIARNTVYPFNYSLNQLSYSDEQTDTQL